MHNSALLSKNLNQQIVTIEGKHLISASNLDVWTRLMDPNVLERITPGISALSPLGDDKFKAISTVKIGPVKGNFEGQLVITDRDENTSATLIIDQKSKIGNVSAEIKMHLSTVGETTEIGYKGDAKLSGKIAMMGQRIIGGVVSSLSKQFFIALEKEMN